MDKLLNDHPKRSSRRESPHFLPVFRKFGASSRALLRFSIHTLNFLKMDRRPPMATVAFAAWLTVALMAAGCSKPGAKDPRL
jgi:hypothetical protein